MNIFKERDCRVELDDYIKLDNEFINKYSELSKDVKK